MRAMTSAMGVALSYDTMIVAKDNGEISPLRHRLTVVGQVAG